MKLSTSVFIISATLLTSVLAARPGMTPSRIRRSTAIYVTCPSITCAVPADCAKHAGQVPPDLPNSFWTDPDCTVCANGKCMAAPRRAAPPPPPPRPSPSKAPAPKKPAAKTPAKKGKN